MTTPDPARREAYARIFQGSAVETDLANYVESFEGPSEDLLWEAWAFAAALQAAPSTEGVE